MRIFIGIDIPIKLKKAISEIQTELCTHGIRTIETENMHITLKFLGEVDQKKISAINCKLTEIKHHKFEIFVKGIGVFPNENYAKIIWVGCESEELVKLVEKINNKLNEFPKEGFKGHITIARIKKKIELKHFLEKYRDWKFGRFKVEKFFLMKSELFPSGPKYKMIAEYKLCTSK